MPTVSTYIDVNYVQHASFDTVPTQNHFNNAAFVRWGGNYDSKSSAYTLPRQTLLYVEVEIPEGAQVSGARLRLIEDPAYGSSTPTIYLRMGLLERDGSWDQTGLTYANYPTRADIPTPIVQAFLPERYEDQGIWHEGNYVDTIHDTVTSGTWYQGDGMTVDRTLTGMSNLIQAFLDDTTSTHRSYSSSGTAVPMLFAWTASPNRPSPDRAYFQTATSISGAAGDSELPLLEIEYTIPGLDQTTALSGSVPGNETLSASKGSNTSLTASQSGNTSLTASQPGNTSLTASKPGNQTLSAEVK